MKVSANDYDADFGRFSGAVIQVTSNSGTNQFHGSFFFKVDRPVLNAWQRWNGQNSIDPGNASKTPANRGLTKDTGWNYFGPLHSKENNLSVVTPGAGSAYLTGLTMTQGVPLYTVQHGNFGPQLGFAWQPMNSRAKSSSAAASVSTIRRINSRSPSPGQETCRRSSPSARAATPPGTAKAMLLAGIVKA